MCLLPSRSSERTCWHFDKKLVIVILKCQPESFQNAMMANIIIVRVQQLISFLAPNYVKGVARLSL